MNANLAFEPDRFSNNRKIEPQEKKLPSKSKNKRVLVIAGPTAAGKTNLSLKLAHILGGEVISADSMQIYKGMDIGTSKVTMKEMGDIPHHLIDNYDLSTPYNVVRYYEEASQKCREILARDHVPIICGGSGFYINSLIYGPPSGPPASSELRLALHQEILDYGLDSLYQKLLKKDAEYAKTVNEKDQNKIVRALEIMTLTNKRVSDFPKVAEEREPLEFDFRCWFIYYPKEILYPRIEMRCDHMIANGFKEEVEYLLTKGLREHLSASQSIGYKQCLEYLDSEKTDKDFERFVWQFKQASRRYAKRQFTWFRKQPIFHWLNLDAYKMEDVIDTIVNDFESPSH